MKLMLLSKDAQYPLKIDQYITGYKMKIETDTKANARVYFSNLELLVTLEVPYVDSENEHLKAQIETLIQWALLQFSPENHYYRDLALHMIAGNEFKKTIVFTHANLHMKIENSTKKNYEVLTVIARQKIDKTEGVLFGEDLDETYEKAWAITSDRLPRNMVASLSPFNRNATTLALLPSFGGNSLMFPTKIPSSNPKEDYDYKYKVTFKTGNKLDYKGTYYEIKENKTGKYITISSKIVYLSEFLKDGYKIAGQEETVVEPKYINTRSGKRLEKKGLKTIKFTYKREPVGLRITKPDGKQFNENYKCFYKDGKTYIRNVELIFKFIGYKYSNNGRSNYSITGFGKTHTINIVKGSDAFEKNNYILLSDLILALEKDFNFKWSGKCWSNNPKRASVVLKTKDSGKIADKYYATDDAKIRATPNGLQIGGNRIFKKGAIIKIVDSSKEPEKVDGSDESWVKVYYDGNNVGYTALRLLDELPKPITGHTFNYKWEKSQHVTQEFKDKAAGVAKSLGIIPDDLMAVMAFESYGCNPAQGNMAGGSAVGLVQFMPDVAEELNTTSAELITMSGVEQLDYVFGYFYPYKGRCKSLGDVYMRVLWPSGVGKNDSYVLYSKGSKYYAANAGLDVNNDGDLTKKEAVQAVIDKRQEYT